MLWQKSCREVVSVSNKISRYRGTSYKGKYPCPHYGNRDPYWYPDRRDTKNSPVERKNGAFDKSDCPAECNFSDVEVYLDCFEDGWINCLYVPARTELDTWDRYLGFVYIVAIYLTFDEKRYHNGVDCLSVCQYTNDQGRLEDIIYCSDKDKPIVYPKANIRYSSS